jgi:hypothetical protein
MQQHFVVTLFRISWRDIPGPMSLVTIYDGSNVLEESLSSSWVVLSSISYTNAICSMT